MNGMRRRNPCLAGVLPFEACAYRIDGGAPGTKVPECTDPGGCCTDDGRLTDECERSTVYPNLLRAIRRCAWLVAKHIAYRSMPHVASAKRAQFDSECAQGGIMQMLNTKTHDVTGRSR